MRPYTFTIILAMTFATAAYAQIDVPVDPLTGRAQISIPMWTASLGNLSVPIGLAYNGGGVKVEEQESTAGIGWSLLAGGQITRDLRGLPDDFEVAGDNRKGWLWSGYSNSMSFTSNEQTNWNTLNSYGYVRDTEPDVFTISAPGISGQFIFDNGRVIRPIPYQDLKIEFYRDPTDNQIRYFTITNNTGIRYVFGQTERTARKTTPNGTVNHFRRNFLYYNFVNETVFVQNWKLTQIISPSGRQIEFTYHPVNPLTPIITTKKIRTAVCDPATGSTGPLLLSYTTVDRLDVVSIKKITYGNMSVDFLWDNNLISSIVVNDGYYFMKKKFTFDYRVIFQLGDQGLGSPDHKAFLKEIKEQSECNSFPSYTFEYESVDYSNNTTIIPFRDKNNADYWGYYNGVGTSMVPTIYYNEAAGDGERFRINPAGLPGYTASTGGANRNVDPSLVMAGSLKRIYYPSGGYAQVTFEAADYNDNGISLLGGGVRVKTVLISDNDADPSNDIIREYEYKLASGQSSGRFIYKPSFAFADGTNYVLVSDNLSPEDQVLYGRTTIKQPGRGKSVYEYSLPGMYPEVTVASTDFAATYSRFARNGATAPGNLRIGYYSYPFAPNTNFDFERGLLTRISDFAEGGSQPVQEKIITYKRLTTTPVYVSGVKFDQFVNSTYQFAQYQVIANVNKVVDEEKTIVYNPSNLNTSVESATTYFYGPSSDLVAEIRKTNSDGGIYKTKIKYAKDFSTITSVDMNDVDTTRMKHNLSIKRMNTTFMHGYVIETLNTIIKAPAPETVLSGSLTLYSDFSNSTKVLPIRSLTTLGGAGFQEAAVSVNGSYQSFTYDAGKYRPGVYFNLYDSYGNILTATDNQRNTSTTHYNFSGSLPVASFANASFNEVTYTDFEGYSGPNHGMLNYTFGSVVDTDARSGKRSFPIGVSVVLERQGMKNGSPQYRFSCFVKATTSTSINIIPQVFNGTSWLSYPITYPATSTGQWLYLERLIPMTGIPTAFDFRVSSSANILIDDIIFCPARAETTTYTYELLNGKTSVTDTRGNSVFYEYDELGRLKFTRDKDKNVVQVNEYKYKSTPPLTLRADFSYTSGELKVGSPVTFTAPPVCVAATYEWKVDGVVTGSDNPVLTYIFPQKKDYWVELTVKAPGYITGNFKAKFSIALADLVVSITDLGTGPMTFCTNPDSRPFSASIVSNPNAASCGLTQIAYGWQYKLCSSSVWANGSSSTSNYTFRYSDAGVSPAQKICNPTNQTGYFAVRVIATATCGGDFVTGMSSEIIVNYDASNTNCQ